MLKQRLWLIWLVFGSLLSLWWAEGIHVSHYLRGFVSNQIFLNIPTEICALVLTVVGAVMWLPKGRARTPWYLFGLAQACFYVTGVMATNYQAIFGRPEPATGLNWTDITNIAFYPLVVLGLYLLDRQRNPERGLAGALDGVVLGTLLVLLVVLLTPRGGIPPVDVIYPAMDVVILGMLLRLKIGAGTIVNPAGVLLTMALLALTCGDVYAGFAEFEQNVAIPFGFGDQFYSFFFVFMGAAALAPSMAALGNRNIKASKVDLPLGTLTGAAIFLAPLILYGGALHVWVPWAYGLAVVDMLIFARR